MQIRTPRRSLLRTLIAVACTGMLAPVVLAQFADGAWPSRPITWVVPFTPGGSTDVIGRTIRQKLAEENPFFDADYADFADFRRFLEIVVDLRSSAQSA